MTNPSNISDHSGGEAGQLEGSERSTMRTTSDKDREM